MWGEPAGGERTKKGGPKCTLCLGDASDAKKVQWCHQVPMSTPFDQ